MWCVCDKKFFGDEIKIFLFLSEEKGDGLIFTMLLKFSLFYLSSPKTTRHTRFAVFSISMTSIILSIVIVSRRRRIIIRRRMRPRRGVVVVFFLPSGKRHLWQDVFVVFIVEPRASRTELLFSLPVELVRFLSRWDS